VETAAVFFCAPVETIQPVEVLRVNDGEFASGEANFAKGITVFVLAIKKNRPGKNKVEPVWNFDLNGCHFISSLF
jgi:hypothetical protein